MAKITVLMFPITAFVSSIPVCSKCGEIFVSKLVVRRVSARPMPNIATNPVVEHPGEVVTTVYDGGTPMEQGAAG